MTKIFKDGVRASVTNEWRTAPQHLSLTKRKEWYAGYDAANIELARIVMMETEL